MMKPPRSDFSQIAAGSRFGRLVVIGPAERPCGGRGYLCQCDCGVKVVHRPHYLTNGRAISCKCARTERVSNLNKTHGQSGKDTRTSEYRSWASMRNRCHDINDSNYFRYGGRGIGVCDRWNSFENFLVDMGPKPSPAHSIERENNNGNYEPSNCVWATKSAQARNRRTSRIVVFRGSEMSLAQAAEEAGISYAAAWRRLKRGEWAAP